MRTLRIAMVQMNPVVGDLTGNVHRIRSWLREAKKAKPDLVMFSELALTGAPPEDLLLTPNFVRDTQQALNEVIRACRGVVAVVGSVEGEGPRKQASLRRSVAMGGQHTLYNAALVIADGRLVGSSRKQHLSNYGVFDESRYFRAGCRLPLFRITGTTIGVAVGGDMWIEGGPAHIQAAAGAEVILSMNASPFHIGKDQFIRQTLATSARTHGVVVAYTNMVGGQDELVFDGSSLIVDSSGQVIARGRAFQEELLVADLQVDSIARRKMAHSRLRSLPQRARRGVDHITVNTSIAVKKKRVCGTPGLVEPLPEIEAVYQGLVLAVKDYVRKNGFTRVVMGLSGGIDSAVTAAIAVDALGAKHVCGVFMPSPYTSRESEEDVADLAQRLDIEMRAIPIVLTFDAYRQSLAPSFAGRAPDITEENLQARIRGNLLMALSNKLGYLVLTTGNKSEMSVGYSTLYGDMAGGFAVIKDVPKTMVYELAKFRNSLKRSSVIPQRTVDRPPTAELRPNQKDEDSLPPYAILDPILHAYVEEDCSLDEMVKAGFDRAVVARVIGMVEGSEFKRRQGPIGVKITQRAFGKDRRMPITNRYHSG